MSEDGDDCAGARHVEDDVSGVYDGLDFVDVL